MARQRSFSLGRSRAESWLQLSQRQRVGFLSYLPGLDHWEAAARDGAWHCAHMEGLHLPCHGLRPCPGSPVSSPSYGFTLLQACDSHLWTF